MIRVRATVKLHATAILEAEDQKELTERIAEFRTDVTDEFGTLHVEDEVGLSDAPPRR